MEIYRQNWVEAVRAADELLALRSFSGSMAGTDEVKYLKAFSLEKAGRKPESASLFASLAQTTGSYYGGLAAERLNPRGTLVKSTASTVRNLDEYPVVYRDQLIKNARTRKIDPRFLLAIMKQESSFKPNAKSPAAARGLLQLVYDTALKYRTKAGYPLLEPDDLYTPAINIAVGSVYIGELRDEFGGLYEAIAASYNGGEDNAARWLNRTKPRDPGIFAAEIGFAETKGYVFKVMNNYRAYRDLYTEDLRRR
jgi:soluble lytic murein transglycosylase-like protein